MARYKITTMHGEIGTVYNVVDTQAPEAEQPAVIASYSTARYQSRAHAAAIACRDVHNDRSKGQAMKTEIACAAFAALGHPLGFIVGDRVGMIGRDDLRGVIIERASARAESQEWRIRWDNGQYGLHRADEIELSI